MPPLVGCVGRTVAAQPAAPVRSLLGASSTSPKEPAAVLPPLTESREEAPRPRRTPQDHTSTPIARRTIHHHRCDSRASRAAELRPSSRRPQVGPLRRPSGRHYRIHTDQPVNRPLGSVPAPLCKGKPRSWYRQLSRRATHFRLGWACPLKVSEARARQEFGPA
jgi:hypothetical protein